MKRNKDFAKIIRFKGDGHSYVMCTAKTYNAARRCVGFVDDRDDVSMGCKQLSGFICARSRASI